MKEMEISIGFGEKKHVNDNELTVASPVSQYEGVLAPGVADHEAIHGVLDGDPYMMSIMPSNDYEGVTIPSRHSAEAAIGPHALGHDGTGWDRRVAVATGENVGAAESATKSNIVRLDHRRRAVRGALTIHGTLFNGDFRKVIKEADDKKADRDNGVIDLFVWKKSGQKFSFKAPVINNAVKISPDDERLVA